MKNFITPDQLDQLDDVVIFDVRHDFQDLNYGPKEYEKEHLLGAFYLSMETDLSGRETQESGRHPLPEPEDFKKVLESAGATNDSVFVVYDDGSNATAPRAWFVLKYFGLEKVYVLDGGFKAAKEAGYEMSQEVPKAQKKLIELSPRKELLADYEEIRSHSEHPDDDKVLIDARSAERFLGKEEPLYDKAGHIPNAVNLPYQGNLSEEGTLLPENQLKERFSALEGKKDIILSCGSGVTACAHFIALDELGYEPRLYVGSYSQWLKKGNKVE